MLQEVSPSSPPSPLGSPWAPHRIVLILRNYEEDSSLREALLVSCCSCCSLLEPQVSPRHATRLHVVGQCDIMGPDIILPLLQPDDSAEHTARVHAHTHVDVHTCGCPQFPE